MLRPSLSLATLTLALLLVCPVGVNAAGAGQDQSGEHLVASLDGKPIPLRDVASYHCHDSNAPAIRCFETAAERDADLSNDVDPAAGDGLTASFSLVSPLSALSVTYVLWYEDANFLGPSFSTAGAVSNLGVLGWSNRISSFKSTNGGRPKWWDGTSYTGTAWQWPTSAWVSYVGDVANDRFSSVQNVP